MKQYLNNTRFAAEALIRSYWSDVEALNLKIVQFNAATKTVTNSGSIKVSAATIEETRGIVATFGRLRELAAQINVSAAEIANRKAATDALCGALLQLAKQGLSIVHGPLPPTPTGPMLGSQKMAFVVWQARNQAMHWEMGAPHPPVVACFKRLDADFGTRLTGDLNSRSLASAIIDLLQWTNLARYENDMTAMG